MLDRDLAALYGVETRVLNQAVKRNTERFPEDFMFQLSAMEWDNLKSQFVISSWGGVRKMPYVFTELGVAMLSSVLTSKVAVQVNMSIMRAFVSVRQALSQYSHSEFAQLKTELKELKAYVNDILTDQNDINEDNRIQLELINESLAELQTNNKLLSHKSYRKVGFNIDNP